MDKYYIDQLIHEYKNEINKNKYYKEILEDYINKLDKYIKIFDEILKERKELLKRYENY